MENHRRRTETQSPASFLYAPANIDVVTGGYNGSSFVNVFVGNGTGSYTRTTSSPVSGANRPYDLAVADVNGDGRPDIVVSNQMSNTLSVLLNTTGAGAATPNFTAQQTVASGIYPASVALADVNGDGRPDIVVANRGSASVSVLLNTTAAGAATPSFAGSQWASRSASAWC